MARNITKKQKKSTMKNSDVIVGIVSGLAVGALLGVLFAPDKGSTTRKKIAQKSLDLKDEVWDGFTDVLTSIANQYNDFNDTATEIEAEENAANDPIAAVVSH